EALPHTTPATDTSLLPASGVALLAAAGPNNPALAPPDLRLTAFTTALLDVLKAGSERYGSRLSLQEIHYLVERRLSELLPDPTRPELRALRQTHGRVEVVPLLPNPAFKRVQAEQRQMAEEQRKAEEAEAARLAEEKRKAEEAARL